MKRTKNEFIEKAILVHGNKYDYSLVDYIKGNNNVTIVCKKHGEFLQSSSEHLKGKGCPKCSMSKGEALIKKFLEQNNIYFIYQKIFGDCQHLSNLRFDFYLPERNILIEFDGIQHYKIFNYFGGEKTFNRTKTNDEIKNKYTKDNGIILFRLSYIGLNNGTVEDMLKNMLLHNCGS